MNVDFHTKMITLLGTPLAQSFAARMQNRGYEAAGLNMLYFYTEADIPASFLRHYPAYRNGNLNLSELARVCDLSRTTVYKYISLLKKEKK